MPLIETDALTKRYPSVTALDALDMSLEPGIIGLVGSNGAGKSTLIKILLGLVQPTAGKAKVLDYDIFTQGPDLRRYVGYMPEHDALPLDMSATEFVAHMGQISGLPRSAARERTAETLRHVGLFEERYREMAGYSTGMKQRVKLAQALVHDPKVVFLDEPTNGLDPAGRDEMLDLVSRTGKEFGIAIVMASHLLGEIERVCEQLIVIDAGKLVRLGSVAEFTTALSALVVEVDHGADALEKLLRDRGLDVRLDGPRVAVGFEGDAPYDIVRDAVVELGLGLVRLDQSRHTLQDLFRTQAAEPEPANV